MLAVPQNFSIFHNRSPKDPDDRPTERTERTDRKSKPADCLGEPKIQLEIVVFKKPQTQLPAKGLSTEELAKEAKVRPASIRSSVCRVGHWCGIRPIKLRNRFLLWPAAEVEKLLQGDAK